MYRVVAHEYGPPDRVLVHEPAVPPGLASGAVLVRMGASTINPSDLIPVSGAYQHRTTLPFVPGYDGVGIVSALGNDVPPEWLGRRVLPLGSPGGWQSWKMVPVEWCVVPDDIDDVQAATAYINPLTAHLMVRALAPRPGDRIGLTAGASTIGRMLIRMLSAAGAHPLAIVRSGAAREALRGEPAEVVHEGAALGRLEAGLDAVGGTAGACLAAAVAPGRPFLHYGLLSGEPLPTAGSAKLTLFRLRDWVHTRPRAVLREEMATTFSFIRSGLAVTRVAGQYPLADFPNALTHATRANSQGKIILRI